MNLKEKNDLINKVEKYHKDYIEKIKSTPDSVAKREILKVEEEYLDYLNDIRNKMNDTEKMQKPESIGYLDPKMSVGLSESRKMEEQRKTKRPTINLKIH